MLNIILVGYGELASSLMLGVLESGHNLAGVLRWERVEYNSLYLKIKDFIYPDPFYSLIKQNKIPEIKARSVNSPQFIKECLKFNPDVILIGSWGQILKKEAIILPKIACVNCHPSLLPRHRGSNPYYSTIKNGETVTGITFHLVDTGVDTGHILLQDIIKITESDTGASLRAKCAFGARQNIRELLDRLEQCDFVPRPQDETIASYFPRINQDDTIINWNNSAKEIYNQIRALYPWSCCYIKHKDQFIKVRSSKITDLNIKGNLTAGTIISKGKKALLVTTVDKNKGLWLEDLEVFGFASGLWSDFYMENFVKAGDVLSDF